MQYREKLLEVTAVQWTGENVAEIEAMCDCTIEYLRGIEEVWIQAASGTNVAKVDDWIVKDIHHNHYVWKPEIFELMFEEVE